MIARKVFKTTLATIFTALLICMILLGSTAPAAAQTATPTAPAPDKRTQGQALLIVARALIEATADETNIDMRDLLRDLYAGKALNDIITAKGGKPENVKAAAKTQVTTAISAAVTEGRLTQVQADVITKNLDTLLDRAMKGEFNGVFRDRVKEKTRTAVERILRQINIANVMFEETAKATGYSQRDLLAQIRLNKSLAQIAKEKNIEGKAIIDAAVTRITQQLDRGVKAGRIKQEDASAIIAMLPAECEKVLNSPNPLIPSTGRRNPGAQPSATPAAPATPSL
jgi:hypothetical protein